MSQNSVELGNAHWTVGGEMDGLEGAVLKAKKFVIANFKDLSSSLGTIFLGIGAAGAAAFIGIGAAAIDMAADVNGAVNRVQAQLGLTEEQAERFADTIKEIYAEGLGKSLEDVGDAVSATYSGLRTVLADAEVGLADNVKSVLALRDTFGLDLARSIDAVGALIGNFGLTADQAFDFVTAGFQRGLNKSDDFLESITEYSNQFADGGADAGQFFALLESGLSSGVLGTDKAADAFKEFRIRITEGSSAAAEALESLGINAAVFQNQIATGQKTAAEAFEEVLEGLRNAQDGTTRFNAGVALLGTQFEDLGESTALGLTLTGTSIESLAGATEKLNEQYDTLGTAAEGIRRKFLLALEPIGQALLEVINQHLPDIEAAFAKLAALGPQFANIFGEALESILETIVPATVAFVEFVAANRELIAVIAELTLKLAPFLIGMGAVLKTVSIATAIMTAFGAGTTAAAGVGTAGGVAGLTASLGPLLGALIPVLGPAGIIAFGAVSVGLLAVEVGRLTEANIQEARSEDALRLTIGQRIAQLEEMGVQVDRNRLNQEDYAATILELNRIEAEAGEELLRIEAEQFAQRALTEQEFVQAKNLALNENLSNEEASQVALLDLDQATKTELLRADAEHTQAILESVGVRAAAKQEIVEEEITGAITAAEFEKALHEDLAAIAEGRALQTEHLYLGVAAKIRGASFRLTSDMSADAVAARRAQAAAAEEARIAYQNSFARSEDASQAFSQLLVELTSEDVKAYERLDATQQASVDNLVSNMLSAGDEAEKIAAAIRESLKQVSLDHRASPSINDLVRDSLDAYTGMMGDALTQTREDLGGLRDEWFTTWDEIGSFVSNTLSFLFDQAQAFIASLGFALGGVAGVLSGRGFAGGGVVGMAGGGLVPVTLNEHGKEPLFLPQGTRVVPHGEAVQALERGAAQQSSVSIDFGNAQFHVRHDADVMTLSRNIGELVLARMSQMGALRGLVQTF